MKRARDADNNLANNMPIDLKKQRRDSNCFALFCQFLRAGLQDDPRPPVIPKKAAVPQRPKNGPKQYFYIGQDISGCPMYEIHPRISYPRKRRS
jgi:hypothetical protein